MSSRGVNKVILVGSLGKDPELRHMPSGSAVCNISLATSDSWKDKTSGEQKEKTEWHQVSEWHQVVFFNRLAEIAGEYLKKGSQIYVEGSLETSKYEKDGITRYSTKIKAREMQMLGGKPEQNTAQTPAAHKPAPQTPADDQFDDDIPF